MRFRSFVLPAVLAAALPAQVSFRSGINLQDMDPTCKPCADFWRYVNGGWLDKNPIPARMPGWGTFPVLIEATAERLRTILEAAAAERSAQPGSNAGKMGDLYASCMDTAAIDARGIAPIQPDFEQITSIHSTGELVTLLARFQRAPEPLYNFSGGAVVGPFRLSARPDYKDPSRVIAQVGGGRGPIFSLP